MTAEIYRNIENTVSDGSMSEIKALTDIQKDIDYGSYVFKELGIDANVNTEDFVYAKLQAKVLVQTYQAEIDSALSSVQTLTNTYLMTNDDYSSLDAQSKTIASQIINTINEDIASGFEDKVDVGEYVQSILNVIKDNTDDLATKYEMQSNLLKTNLVLTKQITLQRILSIQLRKLTIG